MSMRRFTAADLDTGHVPVTQGLAPAPSLSEALLRECRDMGPTLESRVSGPLGRHGVLVWAGCGRVLMLCYVMLALLYSTVLLLQLYRARLYVSLASAMHVWCCGQCTESEDSTELGAQRSESSPHMAWRVSIQPATTNDVAPSEG